MVKWATSSILHCYRTEHTVCNVHWKCCGQLATFPGHNCNPFRQWMQIQVIYLFIMHWSIWKSEWKTKGSQLEILFVTDCNVWIVVPKALVVYESDSTNSPVWDPAMKFVFLVKMCKSLSTYCNVNFFFKPKKET